MMKALHISDDLSLPLEAVTNTHLILARRRVGKSYTAAVMAEEIIKAGLPWVALDPTGVWWGLTSSADGKREGLPVIVIGGPHGHIPLEPTAGKVIANLVVNHPGWYVIDYSRFDHRADEIRFAADFGVQLYRRKQRKPSALHLFIDEADMFVPQKLPKNAQDMLAAYDAIVRRGGVYGLGVTLISQRPALVNADVRTQCETLIALQTTAPLDQDPIFDWVGRNGTDEQLKEIKRTLASLKVGQAWLFSPDSDVFELIKIRERDTFNSSATPKPGAKPIEPKVFANIDIQALGEEITATVERSRQEDPDYLRRQIEQLRRQLAEQKPARVEPKIERVEVPVITPEQIQDLEARVSDVGKVTQEFREIRLEIEKIFNGKIDALNTAALSLSASIDAYRKEPKPAAVTAVTASSSSSPSRAAPQVKAPAAPVEGITGPQQRILDAIAWLENIGIETPKQVAVAFLAGYTFGGGAFNNPRGALRSAGLVEYAGDSIRLTDEGRKVAHYPQTPLTAAAMQDQVMSILPGPHQKILRVLLEKYPTPITKDECARLAGYAPSGAFNNPLGRLRSMGLVDYPQPGYVVAESLLFLE
jgi:uncharacterized protein